MADVPDLRQLLAERRMRAMGAQAPDPYSIMAHPDDPYMRRDGTAKGQGFLGTLPVLNGVSSEYSIADSKDGPDYPSIVPTLTYSELNRVLNAAPWGGRVPASVEQKARAFAAQRRVNHDPAFAGPGEQRTDILPVIRRVR